MNPEDQNPTTNPAAPAGPAPDPTAGTTPTAPATPTTPAASDAPADAALSPADSLAAAQESLTAAANAAAAGPDPIAAADPVAASATTPDPVTTPDPAPTTPADPTTPDTSDTSVTDADTAAIIDEPLVPAAPVPGSIGSVTSIPPVADPAATTDVPADNAFAAAAAAEPAATPFNPFAQPTDAAAPTGSAAPATDSVNPVFQPVNPGTTPAAHSAKKPAIRPQLLILILGIAAGLFLIATIVLAILYVNALNNKEVVYYPQVTDPEPVVETLSCTQVLDLAYLAGYATPVNGNRAVTATYTDDALTALTVSYDATYNSDLDANTARANLEAAQISLVNTPESAFTAAYNVNGATMLADLQSVDDLLTNDAAETLLFGTVSGNPDAMTRTGLEATLTQAGATCTVE